MDFYLIDDKEAWDNFIAGQPFAQFLQSWAWGEFQKSVHRRVWRVGFFENGTQMGAAQIIEHYLGLGWAYLYCPRGPIMKHETWSVEQLTNFLKEKTSAYGEIFLRIEPQQAELHASSFKLQRVPSVQPTHILLLDLSKSEDELLKTMHEKTRYNIRLAGRKNLELGIPAPEQVRYGAGRNNESEIESDDFERFWRLMQETAKRDEIRLHPKKYYQKMIQNIPCFMLQVLSSKKPLTAGLFIGFGDTFTYVHGGSSSEHRELMAPYLMHWEAIKFAKKAGCRYYDFGGVNPEEISDPDFKTKWTGITRFKKGFGGFIHSYAGAYDLPINRTGYKLYRFAKKII